MALSIPLWTGPTSAWAQEIRDYEQEARELYKDQANFENQWPVEFHIRVLEGLTQDVERAMRQLGVGLVPLFASPAAAKLLSTLAAEYNSVDRAEFKIKSGRVAAVGQFAATAKLVLGGVRARDRKRVLWRAGADVLFRRGAQGWRIESLKLTGASSALGDGKRFEEAATWLPAAARAHPVLASISQSDQVHVALLEGEKTPLQPVAMDAHPGVVAIDIDDDGWDDIVAWDIRGPALVLRNNGGKGFEVDDFGLALSDISALVHFDLDNDGKRDLVVGRWFQPSTVLWNQSAAGEVTYSEGKRIAGLPRAVASVSVADVNRDGQLDILFATASQSHHARFARDGERVDANVGRVGPRNVLMVNRGGRSFRDETAARGLVLERSSLQGAFADFDGDNWPDLFVGNDFAPSAMYRNEQGRFVDVSSKSGADQIFFGMGASVEDYDSDGDLDIYVSAMDSSAGRRIVGDGSKLRPTLTPWAKQARVLAYRGNTLLRNDGDWSFTDVTGAERHANWAYGAQFVDVDNDGRLDIYSPNGFFSSRAQPQRETFRDL